MSSSSSSIVFVLITTLLTPCFAPALVLVRVRGEAFVDNEGEYYAPADEYTLEIDYLNGEYRLSGFGVRNELVRPYVSSVFAFRRHLVFRSAARDSKARPVLTVRQDGRAFLITHRLAHGHLVLAGRHWVLPSFARHTLESNALGLAVTFDNPVARAWRTCARYLAK